MFTAQINSDTYYLIGLGILCVVIVVILILTVSFILYEFTSVKKIKDAKKIKDNAYQKAFTIIDDARKKSLDIISESNLKAHKLLEDTQALSQATKVLMEKELKDVSDRQLKSLDSTSKGLLEMYKKVIAEEEGKNVQTLESFSNNLKSELVNEVEEFKDILHRETIETQQMVEQKVNVEFKKAIDEIAAFKNKRLRKVDDNVFRILVLVSKDVFGKILSMEEHQSLVMEALQKAKDNKDLEIWS